VIAIACKIKAADPGARATLRDLDKVPDLKKAVAEWISSSRDSPVAVASLQPLFNAFDSTRRRKRATAEEKRRFVLVCLADLLFFASIFVLSYDVWCLVSSFNHYMCTFATYCARLVV
jgi:hypothetical protein